MRKVERGFVKLVAFGFVAALLVGITASAAHAVPGTFLKSVDMPAAALCGGSTGGTAVAVINGSGVSAGAQCCGFPLQHFDRQGRVRGVPH